MHVISLALAAKNAVLVVTEVISVAFTALQIEEGAKGGAEVFEIRFDFQVKEIA